MDSQRYLGAQTDIIDLFLPELTRALAVNAEVNFNNTRQFDALLKVLEMSLQAADFVLVPSTLVLHILFTLSCRCPTSNWTHRSSHLEGISASTDYMKQINTDYDHTLYKMLVQERSSRVLGAYTDLIGRNSNHSAAVRRLYINMEKVVLKFMPITIKAFFSPTKKKPPKQETLDFDTGPTGLPKQAVVEVISDSEESDSILEAVEPNEIALKYRQFSLPLKSVTSLSDLGSKTSGLGETTQLFRNMPHLLATATPEPEEAGKIVKRPKLISNPISQVQVFDDFLLAKKLELPDTFNIWDLLRWALECADSSSEYQKFLFNSSQTNVHRIYRTYETFFQVYFDFVTVEFLQRNPENPKKLTLLERLLTLLGPSIDWYDRAVEFVFTGLGIPTNSRPFPCYDRERLLIKHDPATQVARCKTTVEFSDNLHSMNLRCRILSLLYCQAKLVAETNDLIKNLSSKLADIDTKYMTEFFNIFAVVNGATRLSGAKLKCFLSDLASCLLAELTSIEIVGYRHDETTEQNVKYITELLRNEQLFSSISDDLSYRRFSEFEAKWKKVNFLASWMLTQVLLRLESVPDVGKVTTYRRITDAAALADANALNFYKEFLDSRSEDADVQAEDINFTLTSEEVKKYTLHNRTSLQLQVQVLLT